MSSSDNWIYFDWLCLFTILAAISTNVLFFKQQEIIWKEINNHTTFVMLLILWLRMFKYARPFENAGMSACEKNLFWLTAETFKTLVSFRSIRGDL